MTQDFNHSVTNTAKKRRVNLANAASGSVKDTPAKNNIKVMGTKSRGTISINLRLLKACSKSQKKS